MLVLRLSVRLPYSEIWSLEPWRPLIDFLRLRNGYSRYLLKTAAIIHLCGRAPALFLEHDARDDDCGRNKEHGYIDQSVEPSPPSGEMPKMRSIKSISGPSSTWTCRADCHTVVRPNAIRLTGATNQLNSALSFYRSRHGTSGSGPGHRTGPEPPAAKERAAQPHRRLLPSASPPPLTLSIVDTAGAKTEQHKQRSTASRRIEARPLRSTARHHVSPHDRLDGLP